MRRIGWVLATSLALTGCKVNLVHRYDLNARLLNDSNTLLSVEGSTNLPSNAPLDATLLDSHGRRLAHFRVNVSDQGSYFAVLDISQAPGTTPLTVEVAYDPVQAPIQVARETGARGEAMRGPLVETSQDRSRLIVRRRLTLQMTSRQAALRQAEQGEAGLHELESYVTRHPQDGEALLSLGIAYLRQRPAEAHPGSRGEAFLLRGLAMGTVNQDLVAEARLWQSRLEAKARAAEAEKKLKKAAEPADAFRTNKVIVPGRALGEFQLGMPMRPVVRRFTLDHYESVQPQDTFKLTDFHDVELVVSDGKVVAARSSSDFFRTQEGIGVGTLVQEVQEKVPGVQVGFGSPEAHSDGCDYAYGKIELEGLTLTIERKINPAFPLPVDRVSAVEVTASEASPPTPTAETPSP